MNMADRWRESVGVVALDSAHEAAAREWARRLDLPLGDNHRHLLQFGAEGLQLLVVEPGAPGPTRVDFVHGAAAHRRQFGGGKGQMIARAIGIAPGVRPIVLDATAGLGRDAFVLATLGCAVTLIERHPLVAALPGTAGDTGTVRRRSGTGPTGADLRDQAGSGRAAHGQRP